MDFSFKYNASELIYLPICTLSALIVKRKLPHSVSFVDASSPSPTGFRYLTDLFKVETRWLQTDWFNWLIIDHECLVSYLLSLFYHIV